MTRSVSFPSLDLVKGGLKLSSTSSVDCDLIPESIVQGTYSCNGFTTHPSHKLSGGAIAGIVVGCVVGFFLLIGLVFLFLRRRTQQKTHRSNELPPQELGGDQKHEIQDQERQYELQTKRGSIERQELPAGTEKAELPTGEEHEKTELPTGLEVSELSAKRWSRTSKGSHNPDAKVDVAENLHNDEVRL